MATGEIRQLYTAIVTANGGRQGQVRSSDGILNVKLVVPAEMGGSGGLGTNPEQLFAGGYAACFESALRLAAATQKKALQEANITAQVTLNSDGKNNYFLSVELHGKLAGMPLNDAMELMRMAHELCPYSKATRGNIAVKLFVE